MATRHDVHARSAPPVRQAVILSAGLGTRIAIVARGYPKATVTTGTRPALISQIQQLHRAGVRRVVVVHAPGDDRHILPLLARAFGGAEVEFLLAVQPRPAGPLDALACASEHLSDGDLTLVLGDTLVSDFAELPPDAVGIGRVETAREFCLVEADPSGHIVGYEDKPDREGASDDAVVGVYRFADGALMRQLLDEASTHGGGELSDLLARYGRRRPLSAVRVRGWQDLGSYDRYLAANRASLLGRAGHRFTVVDDGSVIKSGNPALIAAQVRWFRALPQTAAGLAPRLLEAGEGWHRTELLDYPSLAQLLLYEPLPPATWSLLLTRLLGVMEECLWGPTRRKSPELAVWCERVYIAKTEDRLAAWALWEQIRSRAFVVNGATVPSFDELWPHAVAQLQAVAASATYSSVIHADMTFSNILLARGFGMFKLLDPGSAFSNRPGGDIRYDLAKLRQSYAGGYDALRENLFQLDRTGAGRWELRVFPRPSPITVTADEVIAAAGYDLTAVRLLEAVQFVSMVPLHHENPDRQLALYLRGLQLLTAVLEGDPHALPRA
ncbi:sugar phosphate nucleotidyltransferase [Streptomyces sp. CB03234]|uniref:sugar phosphate nucleotidyltransferase n=1 Tax=Streptomyces sp. (strain CB03234) TaxID=1703937 RepID=UPI0009A1B15A|nr:sugar phosphate nucleotidyltransferase [Streptomyces sp. CB03234]